MDQTSYCRELLTPSSWIDNLIRAKNFAFLSDQRSQLCCGEMGITEVSSKKHWDECLSRAASRAVRDAAIFW